MMAYSAGGYYAPRAVAFEKRYAAVRRVGRRTTIITPSGSSAGRRSRASPNAAATSHFQLPWVLGVAGHGNARWRS